MEEEYKQLFKDNAAHIAGQHEISKSLLKVAERIDESTRKHNDQFVLHASEQSEMGKKVVNIQTRLIKYSVILVVALIIALGGSQILDAAFGIKLF